MKLKELRCCDKCGGQIAPMMFDDLGFDEVRAEGLKGRKCTFLVGPDQTRVTDHICGQNGGKTAFHLKPPYQGA